MVVRAYGCPCTPVLCSGTRSLDSYVQHSHLCNLLAMMEQGYDGEKDQVGPRLCVGVIARVGCG